MASFLRSLHRHLSLTDRFRRGDRTHRDEAGFSLIEAVISVALLALIVVPITHLVVTTEGSANSLHLRAEASDLATQALETAQYQTANGVNPTAGITTTTQHAGTDPFTVAVDWELAAGTGAASTVCIAPPGQLSSRIWTVKVTVSWGNTAQEGQKAHVVATTLVSPTVADLADTNAAEIAVPVYNSDDSTLETTQPITITVTGSCAQGAGMCGTVPSNESTAETANTGSSGCAVFPDLFAGAGETYNITATPPSPYVDPNEVFYTPASGVQIWSAVPVQANQVTVANNPNLILAPGATMSVKFQTVNFGTVTPPTLDTSVNPAPYLPISVESSTLLCSGIGTNTCVLGNPSGTGTNSFSSSASQPAQTALLYPGPLVTNPQISVSTTSGSASVTVASGGFPGVTVGMPVTGTGIAAGTIVSMIVGNTLTLSANATATGTATLTFVAPNYSAWAGDQADSAPSYNGDYMLTTTPPLSDVATSFQDVGPSSNGTLTLPVYPLTLAVTLKSGSASNLALTVTDAGGGDTIALNPGTSSATGLPLGQFEIQATVSGSNETVSSGSNSPVYVWILPTGVCETTGTPLSDPCTTPVTTPIAVNVA